MHIDEQFRIRDLARRERTETELNDGRLVTRIEQIVEAIQHKSVTVDELRFALANRHKIIELRDHCNEMAQEFSRVERLCESALVPEETVIDGSVAFVVYGGSVTRYSCLTACRSAEVRCSGYDPLKTIAYVRTTSKFNEESRSWESGKELFLGRFDTRKAAEAECLSWIKTASCKTATGETVELKDLR